MSQIEWSIRNISGLDIKKGKVGQRRKSFDINVKDIPNGLYFLEVKDKGRGIVLLKKVVLE